MAHSKLTIELPRSSDALHSVLQVLLHYGLISEKKVRAIHQERGTEKPIKVNRWAQVAEEMSAQEYLKGKGDELIESFQTFRDNFEIQDPFTHPVSGSTINSVK
jgi:hypothetical protein